MVVRQGAFPDAQAPERQTRWVTAMQITGTRRQQRGRIEAFAE
jgi:hypothetical protein